MSKEGTMKKSSWLLLVLIVSAAMLLLIGPTAMVAVRIAGWTWNGGCQALL
jgi:hypothetical protein